MTDDNVFEKIGEDDHAILCCIRDGTDDVQQIREATTFSVGKVNYRFRKLQELGLITVEKPDGMVERVIDGTTQVFEAPKHARLTDTGRQYFEWTDRESDLTAYADLSREELVERIHDLEQRVEDLEAAFETFRQQVVRKLDR